VQCLLCEGDTARKVAAVPNKDRAEHGRASLDDLGLVGRCVGQDAMFNILDAGFGGPELIREQEPIS
jgi:hypothetical protein